jgi:hypothetical protein
MDCLGLTEDTMDKIVGSERLARCGFSPCGRYFQPTLFISQEMAGMIDQSDILG